MDSENHPKIRFGLLGPLEAMVAGRPARLGGLRSRGVLAMLLIADGRLASEDALIDALWGEDPPRAARNSLQSHVSRLRGCLAELGGAELGARLRREPGGYRLPVEVGEVDVADVEALLSRARAAVGASRFDDAATLLGRALSCWRGPPLAELADLPGWHTCGLAATRVRLDELESTVREELLEARLAAGSHAAALPEIEQAAAAQPMREHPHRMLAVALYRSGRVTDALAALRRYRDRLVNDAGLDPSTQLVELERAILSGDPALTAPSPRPDPTKSRLHDARTPGVSARARVPLGEFVGRRDELVRVLDRVADAEAGRGGVVLITGEAGIGKTRLLTALTDVVAGHGGVVLSGRCPDGAGTVPYYPFAEAVRKLLATGLDPAREDLVPLAALVPDLVQTIDAPSPLPPLRPDELRLRLLDGMARFLLSLTQPRTVTVVVDDLQWADPSTVAMFRHVARNTRGHRLMVVGAYRSGEVGDLHPLSDALAGLRSETDCMGVHLTGLEQAAIDRLLVEETGAPLASSLVMAISAQTGGNPLFAREMIRHLLEEGRLGPDREGSLCAELPLRSVPDGVRQVIARRRRRLSSAANHLLDVAAAVDGPFPFAPVAAVAELDASTALDGLDEALEAGLVTPEPNPDRYTFAHALIRNTVYTTLNPSRRLRLHRRLAESLEAARTEASTITPAEIAVQYHRSADLPGADRGIEPALQAAALARAAGAHDEDATFLRLARELARPADPRLPEILTRCAVALAWSLCFDEAVATGRAAVEAIAGDSGLAEAATTAADIATTLTAAGSNRHAWELAPRGLELAAAAAEQTAPPVRAALTLLDLERREAADPTNPGIPLDVPERRSALQILHKAGLLTGRADLGRYAVAAVYGSRERIPHEAAEDPTVALLLLGDYTAALPRFEEAAETARVLGQLAWELYCRSGIARCHAALGDLAAAEMAMLLADKLAVRMGGERTSWQLTTHLGARDALAIALDTGWERVLAAARPLLGSGLPEHQWALATLRAAHARGHARLGDAATARPLLPPAVSALRHAPIWAPNYLRTACDVAETLWLLDTREHVPDVETALHEAVRADFRFPMMDPRLALARLYVLDRRDDEAEHWFSASRAILDTQSARPLRAIADHDEARMHILRGDHDKAAPRVVSAAEQFHALGMHGWTRRLAKLTVGQKLPHPP